ncbi:hypothetical protein GCM10011367_03260 [Marinicauda pacifica]|uniref:Uncharacterized protein n=1 Tax=Marinicauda pacifica TaxID=1133559 RepID=A0A4S2HDE4_9PROT|nr:hypothetical protein [Marinicauda pacifica]TGY94014.1 hypothetical protein E5162_01625 [Marinicauda pacifica]GGE32132.1 hypothetical protein GCM10011367_03260 [Marinicauda pacifica]
MSEWEENGLQVDFGQDQASINWRRGRGAMIHINRLPFNGPGQQTESETQAAVRRAAKQALQELLDQL